MHFLKNMLFILISSTAALAQTSVATQFSIDTLVISDLQKLKNSFVNHPTSNCIDSRWLELLTEETAFEDFQNDILELDLTNEVRYDSLSSEKLKSDFELLNAQTPFRLEYNSIVENTVKSFLKHRKTGMGKMITLSEYYFPLFESKLAKYNIPLELKYLAIVESALNPKAKSRVGASGLWQFMYGTGKQFNLEVNSYVDERFDPVKATEAACSYLSELYSIFGDWNLVLAAYNAGPGNVSKAIRRSGGKQNYWEIRPYLPRETANYVPAFMATLYLFMHQDEYGIKGEKAPQTFFETDTLHLKKQMTFKQIEDILDIPEGEIHFLNPIYKQKTIPVFGDKKHALRLSKSKIGLFVSNEDKIYNYLDSLNIKEQRTTFKPTRNVVAVNSNSSQKYHTVRRGQSIGIIAQKYGVSISNLKKWNNLRSNTIIAGKKLVIYSGSKSEVQAVSSNYYIVKRGDSLYTIAKKYSGISANDIKRMNNLKSNNLKPGMRLKIR